MADLHSAHKGRETSSHQHNEDDSNSNNVHDEDHSNSNNEHDDHHSNSSNQHISGLDEDDAKSASGGDTDVDGSKRHVMCAHCIEIQQELSTKKENSGDYDQERPWLSFDRIIHVSAGVNHWQCVQAAIDGGTKVDEPTTEGNWTPLCISLMWGNKDAANCLLDNGANPNHDTSMSPLLMTIKMNNLKCCELLLQHGANPNLRPSHSIDTLRRSPLMMAMYLGEVDFLRLMVAYGARFNAFEVQPKADDPSFPGEWDIFYRFGKHHKKLSSETLEEILLMIYDQEGTLPVGLYMCHFDKHDPAFIHRMLDRNMKLKGMTGGIIFHALEPDFIELTITLLASSDAEFVCLRAIFQYLDKLNSSIYKINNWVSRALRGKVCHQGANPQAIAELLSRGANPDNPLLEESAGFRSIPIVNLVEQGLTKHAAILECIVLLIRHNCDLNVGIPRKDRLGNFVEINLLEYTLLAKNLYGAQLFILSGAHIYRPDHIRLIEDGKLPEGLQCTEEERRVFIKNHLQAPPSLYRLTRVALRRILGCFPDTKIPQLGLTGKVEEFMRYCDLDRIAAKYKADFERVVKPLAEDDNP